VGSPVPLQITEPVSSGKCGISAMNVNGFRHQFFAAEAPWMYLDKPQTLTHAAETDFLLFKGQFAYKCENRISAVQN
jgi:hypothetical protein